MDFKGKVVLITGASSGIGSGTAIYLAKLGASLVLTGRDAVNLNQTAVNCIRPAGVPEPLQIVADIENDADVVQIVEETIRHFGRLDVLVNNAGIVETGSIETTSVQQYEHVMNTNLRSVFHLTMLATPHIIKTKGNIVNVSSVNSLRSCAGVLAYNISKSGMDQLTRCTALELAAKGVRVNSVNPGLVRTNIHRRSGMNEEEYEAFVERVIKVHALGRAGDVTEVAAAIAYLASDLAAFVTGMQLPVDGGRHLICPS